LVQVFGVVQVASSHVWPGAAIADVSFSPHSVHTRSCTPSSVQVASVIVVHLPQTCAQSPLPPQLQADKPTRQNTTISKLKTLANNLLLTLIVMPPFIICYVELYLVHIFMPQPYLDLFIHLSPFEGDKF
jgi:hypothetical protein